MYLRTEICSRRQDGRSIQSGTTGKHWLLEAIFSTVFPHVKGWSTTLTAPSKHNLQLISRVRIVPERSVWFQTFEISSYKGSRMGFQICRKRDVCLETGEDVEVIPVISQHCVFLDEVITVNKMSDFSRPDEIQFCRLRKLSKLAKKNLLCCDAWPGDHK